MRNHKIGHSDYAMGVGVGSHRTSSFHVFFRTTTVKLSKRLVLDSAQHMSFICVTSQSFDAYNATGNYGLHC